MFCRAAISMFTRTFAPKNISSGKINYWKFLLRYECLWLFVGSEYLEKLHKLSHKVFSNVLNFLRIQRIWRTKFIVIFKWTFSEMLLGEKITHSFFFRFSSKFRKCFLLRVSWTLSDLFSAKAKTTKQNLYLKSYQNAFLLRA